MSASSEINDFLAFIGSEKILARNTQSAYEKDLEDYFLFCRRKGLFISKMGLRDLRGYIGTLKRQGLASRSIARKLSAIKQFYKFLLREDRIESDPSELLSVQVKEKRLPKFLTVE